MRFQRQNGTRGARGPAEDRRQQHHREGLRRRPPHRDAGTAPPQGHAPGRHGSGVDEAGRRRGTQSKAKQRKAKQKKVNSSSQRAAAARGPLPLPGCSGAARRRRRRRRRRSGGGRRAAAGAGSPPRRGIVRAAGAALPAGPPSLPAAFCAAAAAAAAAEEEEEAAGAALGLPGAGGGERPGSARRWCRRSAALGSGYGAGRRSPEPGSGAGPRAIARAPVRGCARGRAGASVYVRARMCLHTCACRACTCRHPRANVYTRACTLGLMYAHLRAELAETHARSGWQRRAQLERDSF